jgi:hypothetical protein
MRGRCNARVGKTVESVPPPRCCIAAMRLKERCAR